MIGVQSNKEMEPSDKEMEVNSESQAGEYFDLNLIDDGDSDSGNSGNSDKMEYQVWTAQAQTWKSQETGVAKGKKPQILTQLPSTKTAPRSKESKSYDPEMCCRWQLLVSWYTVLTLSLLTSFCGPMHSSSRQYQFPIYIQYHPKSHSTIFTSLSPRNSIFSLIMSFYSTGWILTSRKIVLLPFRLVISSISSRLGYEHSSYHSAWPMESP